MKFILWPHMHNTTYIWTPIVELCTSYTWTPLSWFSYSFTSLQLFQLMDMFLLDELSMSQCCPENPFQKSPVFHFAPFSPPRCCSPFFRPVVTYHPPSLTLCSTISHQSRPSFSNQLKYNSHLLLWQILDCAWNTCIPCPTPRIAPLSPKLTLFPDKPPSPPLFAGTRDRLGLGEH